jgi:transcriptional regulator with XRE-family HTH domain
MQSKKSEVVLFVATKIKNARLRKGMSQGDLAETIGLTFQQVQKYEKGVNMVSANCLFDIAAAVGQPVSYFFPENKKDVAENEAASVRVEKAEIEEIVSKLKTFLARRRK